MPDDMHGFKFMGENISDYVFAAFLMKHKALHNHTRTGNANTWRDPDGQSVAVVIYDNANMTTRHFYRADLT